MPELLLELLSEEIPARMQARAAEDLKRLVTDRLTEAGLTFDSAEAYVTPRRLTLVVDGLPEKQPDRKVERKGPRVGSPEKAIQGFLKSAGLDSLDQCEVRDVKGTEFYFVVQEKEGGSIEGVLVDALPRVVWSFPWPKSMRWADGRASYVRPLHNIVLLFNGELIRGGISMEGSITLEFNNKTVGHRFLAPEPITVTSFADYHNKLEKARVMLDAAERRRVIERETERIAAAEGLKVKPDPALVAENTGLVEWPVVLMGRIDPAYMDLPSEVLTTVMRHHLKHFALLDKNGNLAPRFLVVANIEASDGGKEIVAGNERVLRARLADAKFFWDHDRKRTLESRVADLDGVVFHARLGEVFRDQKLGSLGEKVYRVAAAARRLAEHIPAANEELCERAARLAKADLTTDMVGEFPELQGVIGRYYALGDGEHREVADAIAEHYSPVGPDDACPTKPVSVCVALADKIDTLFWYFATDERPTGSKDPFALRRAALGVIRLIIENKIRLPLLNAFENAWFRGPEFLDRGKRERVAADLLAFFADRLKVHLREKGVRHDLIGAVFALGHEDDLVRLLARVAALEEFLSSEDGDHLLVAYRRAANIVRIEEKRDGTSYDGAPDAKAFRQDEEKALHAGLAAGAKASAKALGREDFGAAMSALAGLRGPVDTFFDEVTVNCDDKKLRENRLRLLSQIRATMNFVADFSQIEGGER